MAGNQHTLGGRPSTTYRAKSVTWCPLCNSRYVGIPNHGRKRYVCSNFRDLVTDEKKCAPPSLAGDPMETALLGAIRDALGDERQLEASLSEKRRELAAGANAPEIEHLKKQLEQIRRREEKADPRRSKPPRPAMRTRKLLRRRGTRSPRAASKHKTSYAPKP